MKKQSKRLSINDLKKKIQKKTNVSKVTAGAFGKGGGNGEIMKIEIPGEPG